MIVLRVALAFNIPVLDGPNDVSFISGAKLKLDFIPTLRFGILRARPEGC
jgi:hypothetical protein